jgi:hypothetical protein
MKLVPILIVIVVATAGASPYRPQPDEVLERLPTAILAGRSEVDQLRAQLNAAPGDASIAAVVAQGYVRLAKDGGGPRYYGYARAAIDRWWQKDDAPAEVLRARAKLKETDHDYDGALTDLQMILERDSHDSQAWIEVVNLHRVKGDYAAAWKAYERLSAFSEGLANVFCRAPLLAVTGGSDEASEIYERAIPVTRENLPDALPWLLAVRAELAAARGSDELAEKSYREGLAAEPNDGYLKRSYADYLLDRDRADEVGAMIGDDLTDTGCLLAAAIAAKRAGENRAKSLAADLADRFRETRLRGDLPHGRFESRFALELEENAPRALELAIENWGKQKELRDTRNLLEAALATGWTEAAIVAIDFLQNANTEDVALDRLVKQLKAVEESKP